MEKKSKKKILIISLIVFVVLVIAVIIGYVVYQQYQEKLLKEKQEIIASLLEKCNTIETQMELLILNEEQQQEMNVELENIKKAINAEDITENINVSINNLNNKIEEIKTKNNTLLSDKENELNGINIDKFNEEQRNKTTELQNQYQEQKNQGKYKEAQVKIQECIDYKNNTNAEISKAEEAERIRQEEEKKKQQQQASQKRPTQSTQQQKPTQTVPSTQTQTPIQTTPTETPTQTTPSVSEQPSTDINKPSKVYTSSFSITHSGIEWTKDSSGNNYIYTISGTIQNNSGYDLSKVQVFGSFNEHGRGHVGTTTIYNLGKGQRYNFSISIRESMFFTFSNCSVTATGDVK